MTASGQPTESYGFPLAVLAEIEITPNQTFAGFNGRQPHFVRDYSRVVHRIVAAKPDYETAMALAVGGGPYTEIGMRERQLLESLGLQSTHYVIDIGAGSGLKHPAYLRESNS